MEDALAIEPRRLAARCFSLSRLHATWGCGSSGDRGTTPPEPPSCLTDTSRHCLSSSSVSTTIVNITHTPWYRTYNAHDLTPLRYRHNWRCNFHRLAATRATVACVPYRTPHQYRLLLSHKSFLQRQLLTFIVRFFFNRPQTRYCGKCMMLHSRKSHILKGRFEHIPCANPLVGWYLFIILYFIDFSSFIVCYFLLF